MTYGWQVSQVVKALSRGACIHKETRVVFTGEACPFSTFEGLRWLATGSLECWHHASKVMAVDFDKDLVTDFGYSGYSTTTTRYLYGWLNSLQELRFADTPGLDTNWWPFDWTHSYAFNKTPRIRGEGYHEEMFDRFRANVPWVHWLDGMPWFHATGWDGDLNQRYETLRHALLQDQGWRWWTGDWDKRGRWSKRFIDENTERRWNALQKRRQRAQARIDREIA